MDISELKRASSSQKLNRHPWEIARGKAVSFILKKYIIPVTHLIDIGSGDLYVLQNLFKQKLAEKFSAVDSAYTPEIVEQLQQEAFSKNITFYTDFGDIAKQPKSNALFFLDVLEHCENDEQVLSSVASSNIVADGAFFLITVPAFQNLFSQHDILLNHYRRYSRKKIKEICISQNLVIIKSGYFFFSLLPARVFQKMIEKAGIRRVEKSIDNWTGGLLITKIISSILWADFRLCYALSTLGIHLPGLSCYCICKKMPS